jgi:hypothetical protein
MHEMLASPPLKYEETMPVGIKADELDVELQKLEVLAGQFAAYQTSLPRRGEDCSRTPEELYRAIIRLRQRINSVESASVKAADEGSKSPQPTMGRFGGN